MHETFFDTGKHTLTDQEKFELDAFTTNLEKERIVDIFIYGYCDDRGSNEYNKKLSQRRAETIRTFFSSKGIPNKNIKTVDGKGELLLTPLDDSENDVQRQLNRKVEIIVSILDSNELAKEGKTIKPTIYKAFSDEPFKRGDRFLLKNLLFKTNYSYLRGNSRDELKRLAKFLVKNPQIYFKIEGHVCCVEHGRDGIDLKTGLRNLSETRAKLVYDYLADHGVDKKRMRYEGYGSRYPLGGDEDMDKRVEIEVTYIKKN